MQHDGVQANFDGPVEEGDEFGALLVGLLQNYIAFLEPKLALISNIGLMTAILMWRPQGMMPVVEAK